MGRALFKGGGVELYESSNRKMVAQTRSLYESMWLAPTSSEMLNWPIRGAAGDGGLGATGTRRRAGWENPRSPRPWLMSHGPSIEGVTYTAAFGCATPAPKRRRLLVRPPSDPNRQLVLQPISVQ